MPSGPDLLTIVLPVWGDYAAEYLDEAIVSIRSQAVPLRLILVDNASEVPIEERVDVEVVRLATRVSLGAARNAGLAAVESPYVVFWDADDVMLPGALDALLTRVAGEPDAVVVCGLIVEAPPDKLHHWPRPWTMALAHVPSLFAAIHCVSSLFPTIGVLIRTEVARSARGFPDLDTGDDWILGASLAFHGRISFVSARTRLYRAHPGSVSSGWRTRPHLLANARGLRQRLKDDPGVPTWVRWFVPIIGCLQLLVIFVFRPLGRLARGPRRS